MPTIININLLSHIALDSELAGRFGVQGNTFKNTVGYLYSMRDIFLSCHEAA